jgi:hypothetical protein
MIGWHAPDWRLALGGTLLSIIAAALAVTILRDRTHRGG